MSWIKKTLTFLGCMQCQAKIKELEKEVAHWKKLALEFRRPRN